MSQHPVCCLAPSPRWPLASAAAARVEIFVMTWAMPMPVTSTTVRARTIRPTTRIDRAGNVPMEPDITSQLCARPQSP
jgi:hypothetical protein